jgi:polyphosphate kinase 2 (PPK2 family)
MTFRLKDVDTEKKVEDKHAYEKDVERLQARMLQLQLHLHAKKKRLLVMFEGWDASGKGGAIKRLTETLDPRGFTVHPIGAPTPEEQGRHYLWRFWMRVPVPGGIAIFDRSWYGRVCVERVEKFCPKEDWKRAYGEINEWEKSMVDNGCPIVKFFMHISQEEQLKRFREREEDKLKHWKIGPDDWRNRKHAGKYFDAYDEMFDKTNTKHAPWTIVEADWKWYARLKVLQTVVTKLESVV